jgi:hypothetical protein
VLVAACGARSEIGGVAVEAGVLDAAPHDTGTFDAGVHDVVSVDVVEEPPPELTPDFAWYKLDETSGNTAHDSAPNHWDAVVSGVAWNDGAIFDGAACGLVNVADTFRQPPVTISAWLTPATRADASSNAYALTPFPPSAVSGDVPGEGGYGLGLNVWTDDGGGHALAIGAGVNAAIAFHTIDGAFAAGTRYFVAIAIGATSATVYVDGKPTTQTSANVPPSATPTPLHIGCHNDDAGYGTKRFYKGIMRDVRIFKHPLSDQDIAQLFSNGPV